jgi:hypothetical protein
MDGIYRDVIIGSAYMPYDSEDLNLKKKLRNWSCILRTKDWNFSWAAMQTPTMRCGVALTLTRGGKAY